MDLGEQFRVLKPEVSTAINEILSSHAFIKGPAVGAFEKSFANWLEVQNVVGVANGTDAIFLALKALGVGPGDQVITVPNTFIATTEMISATGAEIVWADVSEETYLMDLSSLDELVTDRTKVILPVLLYGNVLDMEALRSFASEKNLRILVDAAQAHGAKWGSYSITDFCDIATYSFYPGKNLGAYGDAGAIATNDKSIAEKIRMISDHGRNEKYIHKFEGYSSRLDSIQAAVLSAKLPYLDDWNSSRRKVASIYAEKLSGISELSIPFSLPKASPVFHLYVVRAGVYRDRLARYLKQRGIQTGIHYPLPLPFQPAYEEKVSQEDKLRFDYVRQISDEILSLPMFPEMTESQIFEVCDAIDCFFALVRDR